MSDELTVKISPHARSVAEKNSAKEGFPSVDAYVDALILEDSLEDFAREPCLQKKIEEGLASPVAGELTRERIAQLVEEGISQAERRK